jgi:hypothetical protein
MYLKLSIGPTDAIVHLSLQKSKDKSKAKVAKPRAGGGRPNSGPLNDVVLPSDLNGDHSGSTSTVRPPDAKPASEVGLPPALITSQQLIFYQVQQAKDQDQPSTWNIGLRVRILSLSMIVKLIACIRKNLERLPFPSRFPHGCVAAHQE